MLRTVGALALVLAFAPPASAQPSVLDTAGVRATSSVSEDSSAGLRHDPEDMVLRRRRDHGLIAAGATLFLAAYTTQIAVAWAVSWVPYFSFIPLISPFFTYFTGSSVEFAVDVAMTALETIGLVLWIAGDVARERVPARIMFHGGAGSVGLVVNGWF